MNTAGASPLMYSRRQTLPYAHQKDRVLPPTFAREDLAAPTNTWRGAAAGRASDSPHGEGETAHPNAYLAFGGSVAPPSASGQKRPREEPWGAVTIETVFVLVKAKPTLIEPLLQEVKAISSVVEARAVTGAWDIVLKLESDYITDALAVVVKDIRSIEGIEATETLVAVNL